MHYLSTGQHLCYDATGREIACRGSGQDGEHMRGHPWPEPRFTPDLETDWAWALYLDKGACGVGQKSGRHFHVWPVRDGGSGP